AAIGDGRIPVDRRIEPRLLRRERIGDDVRGGQGLPGERLGWPLELSRFPYRVLLQTLVRGELEREDGVSFHGFSLGTSSHLRCFQLFKPSSASCTPFAPSSRPQANFLSSPATWRRKSSHCALKALS